MYIILGSLKSKVHEILVLQLKKFRYFKKYTITPFHASKFIMKMKMPTSIDLGPRPRVFVLSVVTQYTVITPSATPFQDAAIDYSSDKLVVALPPILCSKTDETEVTNFNNHAFP